MSNNIGEKDMFISIPCEVCKTSQSSRANDVDTAFVNLQPKSYAHWNRTFTAINKKTYHLTFLQEQADKEIEDFLSSGQPHTVKGFLGWMKHTCFDSHDGGLSLAGTNATDSAIRYMAGIVQYALDKKKIAV